MAVSLIVSFVIALLSGLGVGGGGLFAVYLAMFTTLPQLSVQGINLMFFIVCSSVSVIVQIFRSRIQYLAVALMILTGLFGAFFGVLLTDIVPQDILRKIFGMMLITGGIISLRSTGKEKLSTKDNKRHDDSQQR